MKIQNKCGFWCDDSVTIDSGDIFFNEQHGCLMGYSADIPKLANLNNYVAAGTVFMAIDSEDMKIYNAKTETWLDF